MATEIVSAVAPPPSPTPAPRARPAGCPRRMATRCRSRNKTDYISMAVEGAVNPGVCTRAPRAHAAALPPLLLGQRAAALGHSPSFPLRALSLLSVSLSHARSLSCPPPPPHRAPPPLLNHAFPPPLHPSSRPAARPSPLHPWCIPLPPLSPPRSLSAGARQALIPRRGRSSCCSRAERPSRHPSRRAPCGLFSCPCPHVRVGARRTAHGTTSTACRSTSTPESTV